jgi:peptidoglycan/LPS O-acetylase OafA/YrhL
MKTSSETRRFVAAQSPTDSVPRRQVRAPGGSTSILPIAGPRSWSPGGSFDTAPMSDMTEAGPPTGFRPDLEGLRGLAILLVLGFHAGLSGFAGGFVGVDVFFVLSGFLITGLLIRERERTGAVCLRDFYARRARRILPAAAFVLVITLVLTALFLAPLNLARFAGDAAAAALSVGNIHFASQAMDYFSAAESPSPFLQYWSLGVEEQFYIVWPALLILATHNLRPRLSAGIALAAVLVASLAVAVILTNIAAPWAFYSPATRAWQLALGGLLAVVPLERAGRLVGAALVGGGWLGLVAVGAAAVLISAGTPYPGVAALIPAAGTAALVAAGNRRGSPGSLLAIAPMRFLGRISFSLYLIHWPILVLPAASLAIGADLPLTERLVLCGAAIGLAWLCWRFVEEPFHRGHRFRLPASRVLAVAGASIAASTMFAVLIAWNATAAIEAPADGGPPTAGGASAGGSESPDEVPMPSDRVARVHLTPLPSGIGFEAQSPSHSHVPASLFPPDTATPIPSSGPDATLAQAPDAFPLPVPGSGPLPADLQLKLSAAPRDWERLFRDGCELQEAGSVPPRCVYGDREGSKTVALVGDSVAGQWFPALNRIGRARHWRIVTFIKFNCHFEDIQQYSRILKREYAECEAWLPNVDAQLRALKPDLIVVSANRSERVMNPEDKDPTSQGRAMAHLLETVPGEVAIIVSTPQLPFDPPVCLSQHKTNVQACQAPRTDSFGWRYRLAEQATADTLGARAVIVDMSDWLCPGRVCASVLDKYLVWRDYMHLTATWTASLAPVLEAQLPSLGDP